MNILLVTEDLPVSQLGGAGKHAVLLGNALIDGGHHVEMLGRIRAPGIQGNHGFNGPLHAEIDLSGTGWKEHATGVFNPFRRLHMARRIWQAIQRRGLNWDVIHYHGHYPMVGAMVPAGINFLHTLHDQGSECITKIRFRDNAPCQARDPSACAGCATARPNSIQTYVSAQAVRSLRGMARTAFTRHKAIFVSRFLADRFVQAVGTAPLRSYVIHNFIDAAQIRRALAQAVPLPRHSDPRPTVFMAGRIDHAKGFGSLLNAVPDELLRRLRFAVAGDGPDLASLRARHAHRGVDFFGWQALDSVHASTSSADACVVPSICEESCATTVLEALSLGRPVYALAQGGTPELTAYQTYPGQLKLFGDMHSLVASLSAAATIAPASTVDDLSDIRHRLPEVLVAYAATEAIHVARKVA